MPRSERIKQFVILAIGMVAVMVPLDWYVYSRGMRDGVAAYKRSRQFQMTLDSMYRFGVMDGCTEDSACDKYAQADDDDGGHR